MGPPTSCKMLAVCDAIGHVDGVHAGSTGSSSAARSPMTRSERAKVGGDSRRLTLVCSRRNRPFRPRIARPPNIRNGPCGWQLMPIANVRAGGARGGWGATDAPCVTISGPNRIRGLSSEVACAIWRLLSIIAGDRALAERRWRYRRMHQLKARACRQSARRVKLLRAICSPWRHGQTRPQKYRLVSGCS